MIKIVFLILSASLLINAQSKNTIVVGTGFYPPFTFINEKGELDGFEIELGNEISKKLGKTFIWKQLPFKELFTSLENGNVDLIIGAIHITEERQKKYLFSVPYTNTGLVFIISKKNRDEFYNIEDFKGKRVASKAKSTGYAYLNENKANYNFLINEFPETEDCFKALERSEVDAVVSDYLSSRLYLKAKDSFAIATAPFNLTGIGIVSTKSNFKLMKEINEVIQILHLNNYLKNLYIKWLL